ncbi:hypothetical protein D3C81_31620 [compost metagenome]
MRLASQTAAIVHSELSGLLFALEAKIVSVAGGRATVQPTAKRIFPDNDEAYDYSPVDNVRLLSLVWGGGKAGVSGKVTAGDTCLLIAISHGDEEEPDHKNLSACCALTGFSDQSAFPMPDGVGVRIFQGDASITLDDQIITLLTGGGAQAELKGGAITFDAPEGFTFNGNSKFNGDVGIVGNMSQTGGEGGGGTARFGGDVVIEGTSTATDHLSGGVSGLLHKHKENGEGGGVTDPPTPGQGVGAMRVSEEAVSRALNHGAFLMAGDSHGVVSPGDVIEVTALLGLRVISTQQLALIDAPLVLVNDLCRSSGSGFSPLYSDFVYETAQQAAFAQMLNDAGRGAEVDDLLDWNSLDEVVSVISIEQAVKDGD